MKTNLILDEWYNPDEEYVLKQIQASFLDEAVCGRREGYRIIRLDEGYKILAWQCNMADVQYNDILLPAIITIEIDENMYVSKVQLHSSFKGSQGITCSHRFLNERLKEVLTGMEFKLTNKSITDEHKLYCRHLYELILGACSFLEYCVKNGIEDSYKSESIMTFQSENSMDMVDRLSINGNEIIAKVKFENYIGNILFGVDGEIKKVNGLHISSYLLENNVWKQTKDSKVLYAENREEALMKFMKIISGYWVAYGNKLNVKRKFYFSVLYPTSFFGLFTQSIALVIFNKNYSYFQHCINGLQRVNHIPLCLGVIESMEEGKERFQGFDSDYLY